MFQVISFSSQLLKRNPLRDPHMRSIPVYLPPSYSGTKRYPVVFMLAGFTGTGLSYLSYSFGGETLPQRLDRLISEKRLAECIVVMPDAMTRYGGSQYVNSAAMGPYADYLVKELVPWVDATFSTFGDAAHRVVAGKSSGGFGALSLAMRYPGVFGAVGCHSGDMAFDICYRNTFPKAARALQRYGSVKKFFTAYDRAPKKPKDGFDLLEMIAMAAAYSPNANKRVPENFDLPFDPYTCDLLPKVFDRWLAHDPLVMLEHAPMRKGLSALKALFIDAGTYDDFFLEFAARRFVASLKKHRIAHTYEEFPDTHFDISYRYDRSLPLLVDAVST